MPPSVDSVNRSCALADRITSTTQLSSGLIELARLFSHTIGVSSALGMRGLVLRCRTVNKPASLFLDQAITVGIAIAPFAVTASGTAMTIPVGDCGELVTAVDVLGITHAERARPG